METVYYDQIRYYIFEIFPRRRLVQGIFTRDGGVSPAPWQSLNVGGTNGDLSENIVENRKRIFASVEREVSSIYDSWQVHGNEVAIARKSRPVTAPHKAADIIMTNKPEITLFMRFADCVPIFLFDPIKKGISIIHAGWKGTLNKVIQHAVVSMRDEMGSKPANIIAGIGPSIGPDCYQIGEDVALKTHETFNDRVDEVLFLQEGKYHLDLWKANYVLLLESGVKEIEIAEICTSCHTDDWYSHRGEKGKTGRFGALLALRE
jgi:YfiH family protein